MAAVIRYVKYFTSVGAGVVLGIMAGIIAGIIIGTCIAIMANIL